MKSFVALSALILAVCVVSSQCKKSTRNTNTNINSNGDFLSSYLNSMMDQERKGKAVASRALAAAVPTQQEEEEEQELAADVVEAPAADDSIADEATEPRQERSSAFSPAQLVKYLKSAKTQKFRQ